MASCFYFTCSKRQFSNLNSFSFTTVCVRTCAHVHVCIHVYVGKLYMCICRSQRTISGIILQVPSTLDFFLGGGQSLFLLLCCEFASSFFARKSLTGLKFWKRLVWLAISTPVPFPQGFACLCFPRAGIASPCHHAWLFKMTSRNPLQAFILASQVPCQLSHLSIPIMNGIFPNLFLLLKGG